MLNLTQFVGGNPAKEIKKRFSDDTIKTLLELKWWNWEVENIEQNLDPILNVDMEKLQNLK